LEEPECAIRDAINREEIDPDRVDRWQKLTAEDQQNLKILEEYERRQTESLLQGRGEKSGRKKIVPKSEQKKNKKYRQRLERDEY